MMTAVTPRNASTVSSRRGFVGRIGASSLSTNGYANGRVIVASCSAISRPNEAFRRGPKREGILCPNERVLDARLGRARLVKPRESTVTRLHHRVGQQVEGNSLAADRAWWRDVRANAASGNGDSDSMYEDEDESNEEEDDGEKKNILASLVTGFISRLVKPLQDFGFGRTRLWEGGVGLFMISGVGLAFIIWGWIQGLLSFARKNSYQAFIEFPVACGIQVGTNVRIRGVKAGTVLSVQPSLEKVEVLVEMDDKNVPIPRNSLIEANQSGLIAETIIDITPATPIPVAQWGPLDSGCEGEGLIVCDRGKIKGHQGVSMDELVGICTKLAREMERQNGMHKMFDTTETARNMMLTLQPLLREAAVIAQELRPMMQGVNEQGTLDTLESLAGKTSATVEDIRKLKDAILTEENQELLRQSISTLTKTLQHIEKVSGDISSVSGDPSTRANLRHLIQSLSRLVDA